MAVAAQSNRIDVLSQPKSFHPNFREDRRSIYWVDRLPPQVGKDGTVSILTPRQEQLVYSKMPHKDWRQDRPTAIWIVNDGAKNAECTPRVTALAEHKQPHSEYKYERSVYTTVPEPAKRTTATGRIEQLSTPKNRPGNDNRPDLFWTELPPGASAAAMKANPTPRIDALAEHKNPHSLFKGERAVLWIPPETALKAISTLRLSQLARPRSRTRLPEEYDPYKVSTASKRATATPRITELCVPIPRKIRQKIVV